MRGNGDYQEHEDFEEFNFLEFYFDSDDDDDYKEAIKEILERICNDYDVTYQEAEVMLLIADGKTKDELSDYFLHNYKTFLDVYYLLLFKYGTLERIKEMVYSAELRLNKEEYDKFNGTK